MLGIIGTKIGMTRIFEESGADVPVTLIECKPNTVTQVKTEGKDKTSAVVLGADKRTKETKTKKFYNSKQFKIAAGEEFKKGQTVNLEIFNEVKKVKVTSTSKGKGFQGTIKRHNFARGPETHGSHHHREPGSVGACAAPGRVLKGKKLPGRMGGAQVSVKGLKVAYLDIKNNIIGLKGPVPGPNGGTVRIEIQA